MKKKKEELLLPYFSPINELNFRYDTQKALEWSERNLSKTPPPFEDMLTEVEKINNDLRFKYKNRANLYEDNEKLRTLNNFINTTTETRQETVLYVYYTAREFDMSIDNIYEAYDVVLKDTVYGIDNGYLIGELAERAIAQRSNGEQEIIVLELSIPKGTPLYGMGQGKHVLQRKLTFEYIEKKFVNTVDQNYIKIKAQLTEDKIIENKTKKIQDDITEKISENLGTDAVNFEISPVGLNPGVLFNTSEQVIDLILDSGALQTIFEEDSIIMAPIISFSDAGYVYTKFFTNELTLEPHTVEEQRKLFETAFKETQHQLGTTKKIASTVGMNTILGHTISNLEKRYLLEEYASVAIHELFHYVQYNTENFKARELFKEDITFENYVERLKTNEEAKLAALLDNPYCKSNYKEYICEAFRAKYHPVKKIQDQFPKDIPLTNRFLDNLYDFDAPTSPKNLKESKIEGNEIAINFNHSTDNVAVKEYNIYQDKQLIQTIETKKDLNGLSYAKPGEHQEDLEIKIDGLEQNTEYEFYVTAVDEALNESTPSNVLKVKTKDTEPPNLQGPLSGSALTSSFSRLSWKRPTDNVGVEQIKLRRTQDDLVQIPLVTHLFSSDQIFTVSGSATDYIDYTIEKGKRYTYTMIAIDAAGNESDPSNPVIIQSSDDDDRKQNEDKAQNTSSTSTTLNLGGLFPGIGTGSSSGGFKLFGWLFSPSGWVFHSEYQADMNQESYTIEELLPGQSYLFLVIPLDNEGNPLEDGEKVNVDTQPIEIVDLQVSETKRTFIQLSWTGVDLPKESVSYEIYRNDQKIDTINGTEQQYVDMDLDPGTTYQYQIQPRIESGLQTKQSKKVRGETLAPYEEQIIRLSSIGNDREIITYGKNLGDIVQIQPFENLDEQFVQLQYHSTKKAYQLKRKQTNQVMGIENHQNGTKKIITTDNVKEDSQFWKIQDTLADGALIESLAYPTHVFDVVTDTMVYSKPIVLNPKNMTRKEQQFTLLFDNQPPTAPSNLTYTGLTDHSIDIIWGASEDNVGVSRYDIYNGKDLLASAPSTTLSYTLDNLTSVTEYQLTVNATDGSENQSAASNRLLLTTLPKPPSNVQATDSTQNSVTLIWDESADDKQVTGYDIYQDGQRIKTVGKDTTTVTITDLLPATLYTFSVKSRSITNATYGLNSDSIQAITKPDAPDSLEITDRTASSFVLNWNRGLNGQELIGYDIYQNNQLIQTVESNIQSYKITNLSIGEKYEYSVKAKTNQAESDMSQSIIGYTIIPEPKNFRPDFISNTSVHLYWDVVQNFRSNPLAAYAIYQDDKLITIAGSNDVSIKITDLEPETTYKFSIKALYDNNVSSEISDIFITTLDIINGTYFIKNTFNNSIIEKSQVNNNVLLNPNRQEFLEQQWKISYDYNKKAYRFFTFDGQKNLSIAPDDLLSITSTPEYWTIDSKSNTDDTYVIRSQKNDKKVLFANERTKKLELKEYPSQNETQFHWKINSYDLRAIKEGVYFIKSQAFNNAVMSTHQSLPSICLLKPVKSAYEQWKVEYDESKQAYTIRSVANQQRYLSIDPNDQKPKLQEVNATSYWAIAIDNTVLPGVRIRNDMHRELVLSYSNWKLEKGEFIVSKTNTLLGKFYLEGIY